MNFLLVKLLFIYPSIELNYFCYNWRSLEEEDRGGCGAGYISQPLLSAYFTEDKKLPSSYFTVLFGPSVLDI